MGKSFIVWSSICGSHRAQTVVINKIRARSSLLDQCLCPLCRLSGGHWLVDFAEQQFPQHDSFPRRQLRTDVLTGVHFQSFFPRRNSAAQRFTVAYDGASSPYTTVIWLCTCICCGETFSGVKKLYHCTIANSVIIMSDRLFSIKYISQSKQADGTPSLAVP